MWTLVGAGIKQFNQSAKDMKSILTKSTWIKEKAMEFKPDKNLVITDKGKEVIPTCKCIFHFTKL